VLDTKVLTSLKQKSVTCLY